MNYGDNRIKFVMLQKTVKTEDQKRLDLIDDIIDCIAANNIKLVINEYEFYLVLDEAITNSMEHGNRWQKDKLIHLKCEIKDFRFVIIIKDEGIGFNPASINHDPSKNKILNPRGRGIYIIQKFCLVSWNNLGNEITISLEILK